MISISMRNLAAAAALGAGLAGAGREAAAQTSPADFVHPGQHVFLNAPAIPVRPRVTPDELAIICVWGDTSVTSASSRNTAPRELSVDGVVIDLLVAAMWEGRANMATAAHELGHTVFGLVDLYDTGAALTENVSSF